MAMGPERSKPLNNFPMPCWGSQKFLKCVKVPTDFPNPNSSPSFDNDIDAVREKLMIDLKVAADKLKVSIFDDANPNPKPWNLRTRRAAFKAPQNKNTNFVGSVPENSVGKKKKKKKKKQKIDESRAKFSVSLSKEEVEQDFLTFVGTMPPRRPKKIPRIVQKKLDTLFPGLWLNEVTAQSYKVSNIPE